MDRCIQSNIYQLIFLQYQNYLERVYLLDMKKLPVLLILDPSIEGYYDTFQSEDLSISNSSIIPALQAITAGELVPKSTRGALGNIFMKLKYTIPKIISIWNLLIGFIILLLGWRLLKRIKGSRRPNYRILGEEHESFKSK